MLLISVGYWRPRTLTAWTQNAERALPDPRDFIDPDWSQEERDRVAQYLRAHPIRNRYRGFSECRICGCPNGSTDRSDGTYVWPSGLAHYVEAHSVRLPADFLQRALTGALP